MEQKIDANVLAQIKIAGWQKLSLIDYPGKMAVVIFLAGCNMRCHYCHNRHIWNSRQNVLPFEVVYKELKQRVGWLDAVVVSGGEPTILSELIPLLQALRSLELLIKLDTNGTRPDVVRRVVSMGLVDYVALDIKAPANKHFALTGQLIDKVLETANFLKTQNNVPYMFRTTLTPRLNKTDLVEMGKKIVNGATVWQIQQCRIAGAYSNEKIKKMAECMKEYAQDVVIAGL